MRTLASELRPLVQRIASQPRVYVDANVPASVVAYMRERLGWDALFVVEHDDLRRKPDQHHYRLARQLGRILLSLDHDFFDDRHFPPRESGGVIVFSAPDERTLRRVLRRIDRAFFQDGQRGDSGAPDPQPLLGRKIHADASWSHRRPAAR